MTTIALTTTTTTEGGVEKHKKGGRLQRIQTQNK
jgi:hypothetical protein